jgi:hypothetical protein
MKAAISILCAAGHCVRVHEVLQVPVMAYERHVDERVTTFICVGSLSTSTFIHRSACSSVECRQSS